MTRWACLVLLLLPLAGYSASGTLQLEVTAAWARPTAPGAPTGAVYLTLHNSGEAEVALMGVESTVATESEIHRTVMKDGMMSMLPVAGVIVAPNETVELQPGGLHIMLTGLHHPLVMGEEFPITLRFMGGREQTLLVKVGEMEDKGDMEGMDDMQEMHAH